MSFEKRELQEILFISKEKYNPKITLDKETLCIELENIESNSAKLLKVGEVKDSKSIKNKFEKGDVLYGKLRPYLRKYFYADYKGVCSTEIWVLKPTKLCISKYIYYIIQTERFNVFANISSGTRMPRADWSYMRAVVFSIPDINEQKQIVSILEKYDKYLKIIGDKIESKKNIKRSLLQELLVKENKLSVYDERWESAKLSDLVRVLTPPHKLQKSQFKNSGNYPIIDQSKNAISGWTDDFSSVMKISQPAIIFGDHTCILKYVETPFAQGADGIKVLTTKNQLIPAFLYYYLVANPIVSEGYKRHFTKLKALEVRYPSLEEQQVIASILSSADKEIEALEAKKKLIEQQRKYLLNNLITGSIRVPETIGNNLN